jgi:hypothetical protein
MFLITFGHWYFAGVLFSMAKIASKHYYIIRWCLFLKAIISLYSLFIGIYAYLIKYALTFLKKRIFLIFLRIRKGDICDYVYTSSWDYKNFEFILWSEISGRKNVLLSRLFRKNKNYFTYLRQLVTAIFLISNVALLKFSAQQLSRVFFGICV